MQQPNTANWPARFCAVLLVLGLAAPALRWLAIDGPDGRLYGYADEIPPRPAPGWPSFQDKSLQRWVEKYADVHVGFRMALVRSFNELNFRLFREAPRLQLYATPAHGLYSKMSLDSVHEQVARRAVLDADYRRTAKKLAQVQQLLAARGKVFEVVIASSKAYVYPEGLEGKFTRGRASDPAFGGASFADALRAEGVRFVDGSAILRAVAATGIQTHADSGVHWNYYAGCLVVRALVDDIRSMRPDAMDRIDCGAPRLEDPHLVDLDGWSLLNIWSSAGLREPTPYPTLAARAAPKDGAPKMLFVSDSFVDQLLYPLQATAAYRRLVTSNYFKLRQVDDRTDPRAASTPTTQDENAIRGDLMQDVVDSDVVVLELVDYNLWRLDYGFADYLLARAEGLARIAHGDAIGAYDRESDATSTWNWVREAVEFRLHPQFVDPARRRSIVRFQYVTRGPQTLTGNLVSTDGTAHRFVIDSRGDHLDPFEVVIDAPPDRLDRLTLASNAAPTPLGPHDARVASWMLKNLDIAPAP